MVDVLEIFFVHNIDIFHKEFLLEPVAPYLLFTKHNKSVKEEDVSL